jgi:RNA methyltransferase, TrmH family
MRVPCVHSCARPRGRIYPAPTVITSASNPRLRLVRRLRARAQRARVGLFVCEGEDLVEAALDAGLHLVEALVDPERPVLGDRLSGAEDVEPKLLAELSELAHPPRVIAVFRQADLPRLGPDASPPVGLALWHVADPGNVGTLLRSADALGPAFLCFSQGCADPTGARTLRAAMGATFRVPTGAFEEAPRPRIALVPKGATALWASTFSGKVTFVLGAERLGLPDDVLATCDAAATIPAPGGAGSLNVAAAGAIALYEWRRRTAPDTDSP